MVRVYSMDEHGCTQSLERIHCKNEEAELQNILEQNHDLLPGDQIRPDDPRQWLLIKREMAVPTPGNSSGYVDFLFTDQDAIPTFVECKRYADMRSRRDIVGQVFEYAANGFHYWSQDLLQSYAEDSARRIGLSLEAAIRRIVPADDITPSQFFEKLYTNLREGRTRLILFLDESSPELRVIVEFINAQMERTEMLIVEAKQYLLGDSRIVVPHLFGYTERVRIAKQTASETGRAARVSWDEASFMEAARSNLTPEQMARVEALYALGSRLGFETGWGAGKNGAFTIRHPLLGGKTLAAVYANGDLWIPFGDMERDGFPNVRSDLMELLRQHTAITVLDDYSERRITYRITDWQDHGQQVVHALESLASSRNAV